MAGSNRAARKMARATARQTAHAAISKRVGGYIRVSTEEQTKGFGLETQTAAIRAFAESQGYELADVIADPGVSGATLPADRPGFGQLLAMAEAGEISVILVWKFDRLARNLRHAITTVHDELNARNVELRSVTEAAIDTGSPMGRMIFAIFAGMAEGERETITLRTKGGRVAKANKGGLACGTAPIGYRRREDGTLEVAEEQAAIVREVYALRADGLKLETIADRLNAAGHRGRNGGIWRKGTVAAVLDNQKFRGALEWVFAQGDEIDHILKHGTHEAIIL